MGAGFCDGCWMINHCFMSARFLASVCSGPGGQHSEVGCWWTLTQCYTGVGNQHPTGTGHSCGPRLLSNFPIYLSGLLLDLPILLKDVNIHYERFCSFELLINKVKQSLSEVRKLNQIYTELSSTIIWRIRFKGITFLLFSSNTSIC